MSFPRNHWAALGCLAVLICSSARAATPPAEPAVPFSVQDLVRLERISDVAASPDGKRLIYTLRSTDMEANKGRMSVWILDLSKRGAAPQRLIDGGDNSNSAEWSKDGRFVYF